MRVDGGTLISDGILSDGILSVSMTNYTALPLTHTHTHTHTHSISDGILSVSMTYYSDCARTACSSRVPLLDE